MDNWEIYNYLKAKTLNEVIDRSVTTVNNNSVTNIGRNAFMNCTNLVTASFANAKTANVSSFQNCTQLSKIDFSSVTTISSYAFKGCTSLKSVIIRTSQRAVLSNSNAFEDSLIQSGTGYIYVPDDLVESYKTATNWITYAAQIKPISELEEA